MSLRLGSDPVGGKNMSTLRDFGGLNCGIKTMEKGKTGSKTQLKLVDFMPRKTGIKYSPT